MRRSAGLIVIAVLALAQGALGILRSLEWIRIGSDLFGRGLILIPIVGAIAFVRGAIIAAVAVLYVLFAWAALTGRSWARAIGLAAAVLNGLIVIFVFARAPAGSTLLWGIVPAIVVVYLLTAGRQTAAR